MPTYTYACVDCGDTFDRFHSINANPRFKCERCGGKAKRLMGTGAGLIFKGSGFYETDYKRNGRKHGGEKTGTKEAAATSDSVPKSGSEGKSETKSSKKSSD